MNYDDVDPDEYEKRYAIIPKEKYLRTHWEPIRLEAITSQCYGLNVLDLGCGYGHYTKPICECAKSVFAMDVSERWLKKCSNNCPTAEIVKGDANNLPFEDSSFDVVLAFGLLEYVDKRKVLLEINRILKPSGRFLVMVSNSWNPVRLIETVISHINGQKGQKEPISRLSLTKLLSSSNLSTLKIKMNDGLIWLPKWADDRFGIYCYKLAENIFKPFNRNPFSLNIFIIAEKGVIN